MARTNKHHKEYIERWKFDAVFLTLSVIIFAIIFGLLSKLVSAKETEPYLSPLGQEVSYTDKPVSFVSEDQETETPTSYLLKVFGKDAQDALRILECENKSLNPTATNWNRNGTWDTGIFQINQIHGYTMEQMQDPYQNIDAAKKIFDNRGWTAWACSHVIGIRSFWQ